IVVCSPPPAAAWDLLFALVPENEFLDALRIAARMKWCVVPLLGRNIRHLIPVSHRFRAPCLPPRKLERAVRRYEMGDQLRQDRIVHLELDLPIRLPAVRDARDGRPERILCCRCNESINGRRWPCPTRDE